MAPPADAHQHRLHRRLHPGTRLLLLAFASLTLLAVVVLYGFPGETGRYFAWTITPPLTAAFLGGGYAAGFLLVLLSLRRSDWLHARAPFATILVFTVLTLGATLLHRALLHLSSEQDVARFAAWFWLAVYVFIPPLMAAFLVVQERRVRARRLAAGAGPGGGRRTLPRWLAALLAVQGAVLFAAGAVLLVAPSAARTIWPWPLTPFSARVVAAWLIAFGLAAGLALAEGRLHRMDIAALAYALFGVAELVALARFPDVPRWGSVATWVYVVVMVAVAGTGLAGWVLARRRTNQRLQPALDDPQSRS
jgi:hypothetical protein